MQLINQQIEHAAPLGLVSAAPSGTNKTEIMLHTHRTTRGVRPLLAGIGQKRRHQPKKNRIKTELGHARAPVGAAAAETCDETAPLRAVGKLEEQYNVLVSISCPRLALWGGRPVA
jgi:hypothetical protein